MQLRKESLKKSGPEKIPASLIFQAFFSQLHKLR